MATRIKPQKVKPKAAKQRAVTRIVPEPRATGRRRREFLPPVEAAAAIYITPTICEFQYRNGSQFTNKQVTPSMLRLAFSEEPVDTGWLAPGAVRWGATSYGVYTVGYFPPAVHTIGVQFAGRNKRLRVPMPALIFAGIRNKYYIWATKGKTFNPKAELYYAPLPNLNEHGLICFGNNSHPDVRAGGFGPSWQMFWESIFTDHHLGGRSRAAVKDVREHLLKLSQAKAKTFPPSALLPMNVRLDAAVDRLINRGGE